MTTDSETTKARIVELERELAAKASQFDSLSQRFDEWKARAKEGVAQQRKQIADLTAEVQTLRSSSGTGHPSPLVLSQLLSEMVELTGAMVLDCREGLWETIRQSLPKGNLGSNGDEAAQVAVVSSQFDRYRKRSEQAIKMSTKDNERLREMVATLEKQVEAQQMLTQEAQRSVQQREIAIATLERRLEEAENLLEERDRGHPSLSVRQEFGSPSPSSEQFDIPKFHDSSRRSMETTADEERAEARREFEAELQRLTELHEEERSELLQRIKELEARRTNQSGEDHLQSATSLFPDSHPHSQSKPASNDEAYDSLLSENRVLTQNLASTSAALAKAEAALKKTQNQLQELQRQNAQSGGSRSGTGSGAFAGQASGSGGGFLEQQVMTLKEQVWSLNQQLTEARARSASASEEATQQQYLKEIFIKLMSTTSGEVRKSLMPVFAKLLSLTPKELQAIKSANPSFA
jgi:hypothetical protein